MGICQPTYDHEDHKNIAKDPSSTGDELLDRINRLGTYIQGRIAAIATNSAGEEELTISGHNIDYGGAAAIGEGLSNNIELQSLNLLYSTIDDAGAALIAEGLRKNTTLQRLEISMNNIGDSGAAAVLEGLGKNSTLQYLDISINNISYDGVAAISDVLIKNASLQRLDIRKNNIGDDAAVAIAEGLGKNDTLHYLDISMNNIGNDGAAAIAKGLCKNIALKSLWLRRNNIRHDGATEMAEGLRKNATLQFLDIGRNPMTHTGVLALAKAFRRSQNLQKLKADPGGDEYPQIVTTGKEIGRGEFGTVYLATSKKFDKEVVQKISHTRSNREENYEELILRGLPEHRNVVRVPFLDQGDSLILQAHKGGSLRNYARNCEYGVPLRQFLRYSHGMCLAIEHLHKYGILHRDIALRNYVLTHNLLSPVLIDFGLSWPIEEEKSVQIRGEKMPFRQCAPEVLSTLEYSKAADIYQLGLAMWQLLHGGRQPFSPFVNGQELVQYLNKNMVEDNGCIPLSFKKNGATRLLIGTVKEVVLFCCPYDTAERPTATDVVRKIESLRESVVDVQGEEKEVPKYTPNQSDVEDGLNAYNYTDYNRLKTGGRIDYIDLKKDLEEHEYDKLEKFPEVDLEEHGCDLEDQYQKLETLADVDLEEDGDDSETLPE